LGENELLAQVVVHGVGISHDLETQENRSTAKMTFSVDQVRKQVSTSGQAGCRGSFEDLISTNNAMKLKVFEQSAKMNLLTNEYLYLEKLARDIQFVRDLQIICKKKGDGQNGTVY